MPPVAAAPSAIGQGDGGPTTPQTDQGENPTPEFQVTLGTTQGDFVIAASDTVNDLYDQAKNWINISDQGAQINDGQVSQVTLQQVDPQTGSYVDGQSFPVTDKKDVLAKVHAMGGR